MERASWATNKADFDRAEGAVRKRYFGGGDAGRDHALLDRIGARFAPATVDGWTYRPLRVLGVDPARNELVMEYVEGETLDALFRRTRDPRVFVHAGRWLGLLHRATADADGAVLVFNDYNRTNILLDPSARAVVAMDPGGYAEEWVHPSRSLVMGAFSINRAAVRRPRLVLAALRHYLRGYLEGRGGGPTPALGPGLRYLLRRFRAGHSRAPLRGHASIRTVSGTVECLALGLALRAAGRRLA